jgi:nitrite reductase/ring-hydroxylating ferredoxin subunit
MRLSSDRAVEATLADRRIPKGRLEDPDEVDAVSTAITLRAARPGGGQVNGDFVVRLRRLLAAEFAQVPAAPRLGRRALLVAGGVGVAGLVGAVVDRTILGPDRRLSPGVEKAGSVVPDAGQWTAVLTESELTGGTVHRFTGPSAVGFIINDDRAVWAVSGICTHQGCVLQFDQPARCLRCPCHRAAFWLDGTLITSDIAPAPGTLPRLPSRRRDGQIELLLPRPDVGLGHPTMESGDACNAQ